MQDLLATPPAMPGIQRGHRFHPFEIGMKRVFVQPVVRLKTSGPFEECVIIALCTEKMVAGERGVVNGPKVEEADGEPQEQNADKDRPDLLRALAAVSTSGSHHVALGVPGTNRG